MDKNFFDTQLNRRGTGSLKWDVADHELPMWVADMDFPTAPAVSEAIRKRAEHGAFGYSIIPDEWNLAICDWWQRRHGFRIDPEWLVFCTGVVPAISSSVRKLTTVGENVVLMTPVYNIFFNSVVNNGRHVLECPLSYDGSAYSIDFEDFEKKLADPETSLLILCNPHNPIGKIWDRETLSMIGSLCKKHHVTVISDEIHCDLCDPGKEYIPFASVSEECREISVTCIAPTKAFNLAGLQTAAVVIPDETLRHRVTRALNTDEVAEPNAFAVTAAIAAFREGEEWLDTLRSYIYDNKQVAVRFIESEIGMIRPVASEATYLLWLDCTALTDDSAQLADFLRRRTGLYLSAGTVYGGNGRGFLRMNLACPAGTLEDGLGRLKRGIEQFCTESPKNS